MLGAAIAILVLGLAALVLGVRGRRVGAEPRCRRCAFDLTGLGERGSAACPECGSALGAPGAVVTGRRRHRRPAIGVGVALLLVAGGAGLVVARQARVIPYLPSNVLAWFTRLTGRDAALDEMRTRLDAGTLGASSVAAVVATALHAQADRSRAWDARWGGFVEAASLRGQLGPAEERRYLDQMLAVMRVRTRTSTLAGWSVPVTIDFDVRRGGVRGVNTKSRLSAGVRGYRPETSRFIGGGFGLGPSGGVMGAEQIGFGQIGVPCPSAPIAPEGEQTLDIDLAWWTFWEDGQPAPDDLVEEKLPPASGRLQEARAIRVAQNIADIVAAPAGTEVHVTSSVLGIVNRHQAGAPYTTKQTREGRWERENGAFPASVAVNLTVGTGDFGPDAVGAFDVYVVADGQEQWLARAALAPGVEECVQGMVSIPPEAKSVDIVLKPAAEVALVKVTGSRSIAGDELVIEGVPVVSGFPRQQQRGLRPAYLSHKKGDGH